MTNVLSKFFENAKSSGDEVCWHYNDGEGWKTLSWKEASEEVKNAARVLLSLGAKKGDCIGILAPNSHRWVIYDLAIMSIGAIAVPIYPYLSNSAMTAITKDANISILIGESELCTLSIDKTNEVHNSIAFEPIESSLDDIATIVYTSGTTGEPRGVPLSYGNISAEVKSVSSIFSFGRNKIGLLCLPLAHVLGRLLEFYQIENACQLAFGRGVEKLPEDYLEVSPHFTCVVPRMLEKIYERVDEWKKSHSKLAQRIIDIALNNEKERRFLLRRSMKVGIYKSLIHLLADRFLFKMLRSRLGGRIDAIISGGAALKRDVANFFYSVGIPVYEGYGLTETFAAITVNRPDDYRLGTVGKPISTVEIKIADDEEILVKGPMVFNGYGSKGKFLRNSFDDEGWFYTGDLGEFTKDGFLRLKGRKKDLIITSAGKNVVPSMVEGLLVKSSYVDQAFIHGDGQKYIIAIIVMNRRRVLSYLHEKGIYPMPSEDLNNIPEIKELYEKIVLDVNTTLGRHEAIKKFLLLNEPFTVKGGELTYTMKLRREIITKHFEMEIERLYE